MKLLRAYCQVLIPTFFIAFSILVLPMLSAHAALFDTSGDGTGTSAVAPDCSVSGVGNLVVNITSPTPVFVDPNSGGQVTYTVAPSNSAAANCPVQLTAYIIDGTSDTPAATDQIAGSASFGTNSTSISQQYSQDAADGGVRVWVRYTDSNGNTIYNSAQVAITEQQSAAGTQNPGGTSGTQASGVSGANTVSGAGATCGSDTTICNPVAGGTAKTIQDLFVLAIKYMLGLIGIVAVMMIIVGGYQMVTSAGNEEGWTKGKHTLMYAVSGVLLAVLSYSIVSIIENVIRTQK